MFMPTLFLGLTLSVPPSQPPVPSSAEQVRQSVERSLEFSQKGAMEWRQRWNCASCHHVAMSIWARTEARSRGFKINDKALDEMRDYTIHDKRAEGGINDVFLSIYMNLASPATAKLDGETAAWLKKKSALILSKQAADGSWKLMSGLSVPPIIDVGEVQTMQALLAVAGAHEKGLVDEKAWTSFRDRALAWLRKNKFLDQNQSWNLRVLVAQRFGKAEEVQTLVKQLLEQQNADGGWSQAKCPTESPKRKVRRPSDAMATGQTLYALATAGVDSQAPAVQRAQAFLIRTQTENGSWRVKSRGATTPNCRDMMVYHGTNWAALGLMRTLPMQGDKQGNTGTPTKAEPTPAQAKK
jgi:hypothetical protein